MWAAISWLFLNCFRELRIACTVAQLEREGGVSPRISPLAQVHLKVAFNGRIVVGLRKVTWHDLPRTVKRGGLGRENKGCAEVFHWKFINSVSRWRSYTALPREFLVRCTIVNML
jgi:hypothetical protein